MIKKTIERLLNTLLHYIFWFEEDYFFNRSSAVKEAYVLSKRQSAEFILDNISKAVCFPKREQLWNYCISNSKPSGLFMELGVWSGKSINVLGKMLEDINPEQKFYGFDSFEGLKEDMVGSSTPKGSFDLKGILPRVRDSVVLIKGWVQDTVPPFLEQKKSYISFMHIDVDTYESTKVILVSALPWLEEGSIIVFDDYLGAPGWAHGQHRALVEFAKETGVKYDYIGFSSRQAAIQLSLHSTH